MSASLGPSLSALVRLMLETGGYFHFSALWETFSSTDSTLLLPPLAGYTMVGGGLRDLRLETGGNPD